jgi:hypothetical protein
VPGEKLALWSRRTSSTTGGVRDGAGARADRRRQFPFVQESGRGLASALPSGQARTPPDQTHDVAPDAMAAALHEFFGA